MDRPSKRRASRIGGDNNRKSRNSGGDAPERRDEVLNAAALAFMQRGYAGTSIDDIANVAGSTKGRVYHYWGSKSELFFDVIVMALDRTETPVRAVFDRNLPPREKLHAMAREHVLAITTHFPAAKVGVQGIQKALFSVDSIAEHRAMRRIIRRRDRFEFMYKQVLLAGIEKRVFRDAPVELLSKAVLGSLNWITIWYNPDRANSPARRRDLAEQLADFVVAGVAR